MTTDEQLAVSISKAAKLLDCSPATVRRAIERGELRAVRLMGKVIVGSSNWSAIAVSSGLSRRPRRWSTPSQSWLGWPRFHSGTVEESPHDLRGGFVTGW